MEIPYLGSDGLVRTLYIHEALEKILEPAAPAPVRDLLRDARASHDKAGELFNVREDGKLPNNYVRPAKSENQKGMLSYVPVARVSPDIHQNWEGVARQVAKPGKWLHTMFKDAALEAYGINDAVIEQLSNVITAGLTDKYEIVLVPANQIRDWYCTKRVKKGSNRYYDHRATVEGTAFMSCMHWTNDTSECHSPRTFDFYDAIHPAGSLEMAIVLNSDGELVARSLLWHGEGITYKSGYYANGRENGANPIYYPEMHSLDYAYYDGSETGELLRNYARDKGWFYYGRGYGQELRKGDPNNVLRFRVRTGLTAQWPSSPYMDSMKYYKAHKGYLYTANIYTPESFNDVCDKAAQSIANEPKLQPGEHSGYGGISLIEQEEPFASFRELLNRAVRE